MEKVKHILFYTCNCNTRIKFTVMKEPQMAKFKVTTANGFNREFT